VTNKIKLIVVLFCYLSFLSFGLYALDPGDEVPGRLVVNFDSGVIDLPVGETTVSVDSNSVQDQETLDSLISIGADSLEKLFKLAFLGEASPPVPELSQYFIVYFKEEMDLDDAISSLDPLDETVTVEKDYVMIAYDHSQ